MRGGACAIGVGLLSALALGQTHVGKQLEIFIDQDQPYVSAGFAQGLKVGSQLTVTGGPAIGRSTEHKDIGTATVVEVWESLARLQLDAAANATKGRKFVRVATSEDRVASGTDVSSPGAGATNTVVPVPLVAVSAGPPEPALPVRVTMQMQRFWIHNDGDVPLHRCEMRLPDNRHYVLSGPLEAKDDEAVMLFRFSQDGVPLDKPLDQVLVKCTEGEKLVRL